MADQGQREPTSDSGTRQRWTRCGLVSPEGSNRRSSRPSSSDDLPPKKNDTAFVEKGEQGAEGTRKGNGDLQTKTWPEADTSGEP